MKIAIKRVFAGSLMFALTLLFFSSTLQAQGNTEATAQGKTVYEVINSIENTSEFATLLDKAGYGQVLKQQNGTYTVLAPNNEAVQNAESSLKESPKKLMQGQLFKGEVPKEQIESQMGVTVQESYNSASNGVVYVVDKIVQQ